MVYNLNNIIIIIIKYSIKILQNRINKLTEDNEILLNNYNNLSDSYKKGVVYLFYVIKRIIIIQYI